MKLFDQTGDPRHDRHERVVHQGTFNAAPPSAAAGIVALQRIAGGGPTREADRLAESLRDSWDKVLEHHGIAGYVYGPASTFHVYFETNPERPGRQDEPAGTAHQRSQAPQGQPGTLINQYQRHLRYRGVDIMSSTGGVPLCAHTEEDMPGPPLPSRRRDRAARGRADPILVDGGCMSWRAVGLVGLLMLAATLGYVDRQAVVAVSPTLIEEFDLTNQMWGWTNSAFSLVYIFGSVLEACGSTASA